MKTSGKGRLRSKRLRSPSPQSGPENDTASDKTKPATASSKTKKRRTSTDSTTSNNSNRPRSGRRGQRSDSVESNLSTQSNISNTEQSKQKASGKESENPNVSQPSEQQDKTSEVTDKDKTDTTTNKDKTDTTKNQEKTNTTTNKIETSVSKVETLPSKTDIDVKSTVWPMQELKFPNFMYTEEDGYGNKLPKDPKEGIDKIIPHNLDKWTCDICTVECANRVGLINHRKTHFRPRNWYSKLTPEQKEQLAQQSDANRSGPQSSVEESKPPKCEPGSSQPPPAASPLPGETPKQDAFAPEEDDYEARKAKQLKQFSDDELLQELVRQRVVFKCICGTAFVKDDLLYYLHKSSHDEIERKCGHCGHRAENWYAFQTHFFNHKKNT